MMHVALTRATVFTSNLKYPYLLFQDCIINDNHEYLKKFLEGLAAPERSVQIQDWDTSGRVYLDYIRVIQTLKAIQKVRHRSKQGIIY